MRILVAVLIAALPAFGQPATPFTVVEVSRRFDASDQSVKESRFLFAMSKDGSIASVDLDPSSGGTRQVIDMVKQRSIIVNPNSKSAGILPYANHQPQFAFATCEQRFRSILGASVAVEKSAGEIQGVSLDRISVSLPNKRAMEILVAPSLACHMIDIKTFHNGILQEIRTSEKLQIADPDPTLFQIPADYTIIGVAFSKR